MGPECLKLALVSELKFVLQYFLFHNIKIDNTFFERVEEFKYLGQQQELSSKQNKACSVIRTIKSLISFKVLKVLYICYVHSIISYGLMSQQMYFYHSKKNN